MTDMEKHAKIYVAGHSGMVGSAIIRKLTELGYTNLVIRSSKELDLRRQEQVEAFFEQERPDYVFLAAAKVGGIMANDTYPADFMYENSMIEMNVIHSAWQNQVKKLLFLGSSCIYPKYADQPIKEGSLLSGALEKTNEAYAIAKIAGLKYCTYLRRQHGADFISAMPTNLYGPNDNYHLQNSHVLPALIRKFHEAKISHSPEVVVWGSGKPKREFLHVDDLADACVFLMQHYSAEETVNVGTGEDISIAELSAIVAQVIGYEGKIVFDTSKPDGTPRKLLDVSKLHQAGWHHSIDLQTGIARTYEDYLAGKSRGMEAE
jgi:GDP-L-fucose synthase